MNDPHVVALHYRIEHEPDVIDWSRAAPMEKEEHRFRVQAANGRVRFEFKQHYASERAARSAVETDYIRNWEFVVGLARGPNAFTLRFDRSEIVDRNPPSGPPRLSAHARVGGFTASAHLAPLAPAAFPEPPPAAIRRNCDIDSMYQHYLRHLGGEEPLPAMAYFCLTKLEQMAGGRDAAADRFSISKRVLRRIAGLSTNKGGASARKAVGHSVPHTPEEERFLRSAIRTLIHRAAEVECGLDPSRPKITLADICSTR